MNSSNATVPISCNALQEMQWQVLLALTRAPWSSLYQLADALQLARDEVQAYLDQGDASGCLQVIEQGLAHFPRRLYAPTPLGITQLAQWLGVPESLVLHHLGCTSFRFGSLRSGLSVARVVAQFCAGLLRVCRTRGEEFIWETFIPRRYKGVELLIHARLNLIHDNDCRAWYLLIDDGGRPVWMWWRHLRYFDLWVRRNPDSLPPLLILSFTESRALSLLALGQQLCPAVQIMTCADRETALGTNPLQAVWWTIEDDAIVTANPFDQAPSTQDAHRIWPMQTLLKRMQSAAKRNQQDAPPSIAAADLEAISNAESVKALESLHDDAMRIFDFICLHSACPTSAMICLLDLSAEIVDDMLSRLVALNLISGFDYKPTIRKLRTVANFQIADAIMMYSATEAAAQAWWLRQACPGAEAFARRYMRAATDHTRRAAHTLAVFSFFEQLHTQANGWSRVHRKVDAPLEDVNEGELPHIELEAFDDDLNATASYMLDGIPSRWSPDGYGVLRSGTTRVRFWLEVDGSAAGPAHPSAEVWERKLGSLCGYLASDKWMLSYPNFPQLLIVTQDLRIAPLVSDTLLKAATSFRVDLPKVFVASAAAVAQQGPLGKVWRAAHDAHEAGFVYAFPPMV